MDFKTIIKDTLKLRNRFPNRLGKKNRFLDLVEEVGELANAILLSEDVKPDKHKTGSKAEIEDAMADILYNLILLSDHYDVDLEQAYIDMLEHVNKRIDEREKDK